MLTPFVRRRTASAIHDDARARADALRTKAWADNLGLQFSINPDDTACVLAETGCNPGGVNQSDD